MELFGDHAVAVKSDSLVQKLQNAAFKQLRSIQERTKVQQEQ